MFVRSITLLPFLWRLHDHIYYILYIGYIFNHTIHDRGRFVKEKMADPGIKSRERCIEHTNFDEKGCVRAEVLLFLDMKQSICYS